MRIPAKAGFTLIELMIVVAVVAILAAIAYPAFQTQVRKGRMAQAQADVMEIAQFMERCFAANSTYVNCALPFAVSPRTGTAYYDVTLAAGAQPRTQFILTAAPTAAGRQDLQACGTLRLNEVGVKTFSGAGQTPATCW